MAIAFARARYLSGATGGNAVRSAAYNAREAITAERTGELFHFRRFKFICRGMSHHGRSGKGDNAGPAHL